MREIKKVAACSCYIDGGYKLDRGNIGSNKVYQTKLEYKIIEKLLYKIIKDL